MLSLLCDAHKIVELKFLNARKKLDGLGHKDVPIWFVALTLLTCSYVHARTHTRTHNIPRKTSNNESELSNKTHILNRKF
mmetsp:Transcript_24529/g.39356  ORF Transcript_24529/g.39356 Transcript_24529/m.39356 type:complete len:80 (-) Transcript_24529:88-327(-)